MERSPKGPETIQIIWYITWSVERVSLGIVMRVSGRYLLSRYLDPRGSSINSSVVLLHASPPVQGGDLRMTGKDLTLHLSPSLHHLPLNLHVPHPEEKPSSPDSSNAEYSGHALTPRPVIFCGFWCVVVLGLISRL